MKMGVAPENDVAAPVGKVFAFERVEVARRVGAHTARLDDERAAVGERVERVGAAFHGDERRKEHHQTRDQKNQPEKRHEADGFPARRARDEERNETGAAHPQEREKSETAAENRDEGVALCQSRWVGRALPEQGFVGAKFALKTGIGKHGKSETGRQSAAFKCERIKRSTSRGFGIAKNPVSMVLSPSPEPLTTFIKIKSPSRSE